MPTCEQLLADKATHEGAIAGLQSSLNQNSADLNLAIAACSSGDPGCPVPLNLGSATLRMAFLMQSGSPLAMLYMALLLFYAEQASIQSAIAGRQFFLNGINKQIADQGC